MKNCLSGGVRSTRPRPSSRAIRTGNRSLPNRRFRPSVIAIRASEFEPAPALVAGEHRGAARVETEPLRVDHQLGERCDVAQSEVPALAGDRVDGMGGIADQSEAAVGVALGLDHRERIVPARPGQRQGAEPVAGTLGELGQEIGVVEGGQLAREPVLGRPDDR